MEGHVFNYKVKWYNDIDEKCNKSKGKVFAENYDVAANTLMMYYGKEAIESMTISIIDDSEYGILEEGRKEYYE